MSGIPPNLIARIEKTLRENEEAIRRSKIEAAQREELFRQSNIVIERAFSRLKRAGLLS